MVLLALHIEEDRRRLEMVLLLVLLLQYSSSVGNSTTTRVAVGETVHECGRFVLPAHDRAEQTVIYCTSGVLFDLEAFVLCRRRGRPRSSILES